MSDHESGASDQPREITCREVVEFLLAYLERDLDAPSRTEFERHLDQCPPCKHYVDGYRGTIELVRRCLDGGPSTAECQADAGKAKREPPPEHLIQAILSAKRAKS